MQKSDNLVESNKNAIVYDGSASKKRNIIIKPNLYQLNGSFVITDPNGIIFCETENVFKENGYRIFVLDMINMEKSMHYNPFRYIKGYRDIYTLASVLVKWQGVEDLQDIEKGTGILDPFYEQASLSLLQAVIGYIWYELPLEKQNIITLYELLGMDEEELDVVFDEFTKKYPNLPIIHPIINHWKNYKYIKKTEKLGKSVFIYIGFILAMFGIPEIAELVKDDELQFDTYGDSDQKSILYVIISDTDTTYNFIPAILFTQMFNVLCYKADKEMGGKLATPIRFILDEFANIGRIPEFENLIRKTKKRSISIILLVRQSQLQEIYGKDAEKIICSCDIGRVLIDLPYESIRIKGSCKIFHKLKFIIKTILRKIKLS